MKKLLVLLFSILISLNSYGEWIKVTENLSGDAFYYVDTQTINEGGRYLYWWDLGDSEKLVAGTLSAKFYQEGDCQVNRYRTLSYVFYKQRMGGGKGVTDNPQNPEWTYPTPGSVEKKILDFVCDYVN